VNALDGLLYLGPRVHISDGAGRFALSGALDHGIANATVELKGENGQYTRPGLKLVGNAEAVLKISKWQLDGGAPEIGGSSLNLSDVYMAGARGHTRDWWGKFKIVSGQVSDSLTAKVALECRDARPLVAFLGEGLPKWAQGPLELEGLTATAEVVLSEPRTTVRNLVASGEKTKIEGEYDRRGESSRGAFYIQGGLLSVGVELNNGKAVLHLFGPRKWFESARGQISPSR